MYGPLRKLLGSWILLISVIIPCGSYGQTPTPGITSDKSKPKATSEQKKSAAEQHGTEQALFVVKVLPSDNADPKTKQILEDHHSESPIEGWPSAEGWLVIFTAGLFAATFMLWKATERLVKGAEDTARRQLRAYVSLSISAKPYPPSDPNRYAISLIVTNGGKTWARNLRIQMEVIAQEPGDGRDPFDLMNQDVRPPMVLGPGQTLDLQLPDVLRSDVPEIANGNVRHSYIAVARYEDTVSPTVVIRQTQLSMRLNGDTEGGISFGYLSTHNCADEDCQS